MSYVGLARLILEYELPDEPSELIDLYLLLMLRRGIDTIAEDVHDAWAIWRSRTRPDHPALIPFEALHPDTQRLDDSYIEAIHRAAKAIDRMVP